jgi:hypothetical protein
MMGGTRALCPPFVLTLAVPSYLRAPAPLLGLGVQRLSVHHMFLKLEERRMSVPGLGMPGARVAWGPGRLGSGSPGVRVAWGWGCGLLHGVLPVCFLARDITFSLCRNH